MKHTTKTLIASAAIALSTTACIPKWGGRTVTEPFDPAKCAVLLTEAGDPRAGDQVGELRKNNYAVDYKNGIWYVQRTKDTVPYIFAYAAEEDAAAYNYRGCIPA